ncbi:hypothetical protein [Archaeoglobus veneficus]|uniref:Uncharacterized protein n=1 Tax=Archaeoglobus veneficus (strain DSM 11195 / SNP6) TaxID=693661 RepID=F2KR43_ARCVS|nr:hypothetical protein [Archaeoglobus veneficus]AEA46680.1 hypothetical protein Arcve_0660 [Archaeoglobus veneficus SNP6]
MPRNVISASVDDDVLSALKEFKNNGGNVSRLVNSLLRNYFFGNNDDKVITKEILKIRELERKVKQAYEIINSIQPELEELRKKFEQEQEAKEIEQNLSLIRLLELEVFDDLKDFEAFERTARRTGFKPKDLIEQRLSAFAAQNKLSLQEAWQLFFKVFPDLKEYLEG